MTLNHVLTKTYSLICKMGWQSSYSTGLLGGLDKVMQVKLCLLGTIQAPDKCHQLLLLRDFPCIALQSPYQPLRSYPCVTPSRKHSLIPSRLFTPFLATSCLSLNVWLYTNLLFILKFPAEGLCLILFFFPKLGYSCLTVLLVSAVQWSESATYIYTYTSPHSWISLPSPHPTHLGHHGALSFPCYTAGSH